MIIYLPFADFGECAQVLDTRRLYNQRRDAHNLLAALLTQDLNDVPVALFNMWEGYAGALANYNIALSKEIDDRGFEDPYFYRTFSLVHRYNLSFVDALKPWWLGEESVHSSHRSLLKREVIEALAKASFAAKNAERLNVDTPPWELERVLTNAREEFEWYDRYSWTDSMLAPLVWPKN